MKLKKIISAISALAMTISMVTVANAASLGGKPTVTATFDSYEKVSDTVAFAYVNITIDMTAAETLEAYSNELDETTWEEVVKGNGITTIGSSWTVPTGFTYTKAKSTIPSGLTVDATKMAFGPKTSAEEYWVEPITTIKLAYRVSDFDAKGDIVLTTGGTTIDGTNSAENNAVWSYADAAGTITLTGCSIPSYNEWSTPAEPEYTYGDEQYVTEEINIAGVTNPYVRVTLDGAKVDGTNDYYLPAGVLGGTTKLHALLKYTAAEDGINHGDVFSFTLRSKDSAEGSDVEGVTIKSHTVDLTD